MIADPQRWVTPVLGMLRKVHAVQTRFRPDSLAA